MNITKYDFTWKGNAIRFLLNRAPGSNSFDLSINVLIVCFLMLIWSDPMCMWSIFISKNMFFLFLFDLCNVLSYVCILYYGGSYVMIIDDDECHGNFTSHHWLCLHILWNYSITITCWNLIYFVLIALPALQLFLQILLYKFIECFVLRELFYNLFPWLVIFKLIDCNYKIISKIIILKTLY